MTARAIVRAAVAFDKSADSNIIIYYYFSCQQIFTKNINLVN